MQIHSSFKQLLLAAAITIASFNATGATWYVRSGATGTGSGTNWTNAFPSLPQTLVRGDIYYIADGTYPAYTFDDPPNGTTYITVRKATIVDHGSADGWDNSFGDGEARFTGTLTFRSNYWLLDGQERASLTSGYGIVVDPIGPSKGLLFLGTGSGVSFVTVQYVEVAGNGPDDDSNPADDGIYAAEFHDTLRFRFLYVHDHGRVPFLLRNQQNLLVEYCFIARNETHPNQHSEAIALFSGAVSTNCTFRYNTFEDIEGTGVIVVGGIANGAPATNCVFHGNIIYWTSSYPNPGQAGGYTGNGAITSQTTEVHSNSVYSNNVVILPRAGGASFRLGSLGNATGNLCRNNIFYCEGPIGTRLGRVSSNTYDSNSYSAAGSWSIGDPNVKTDVTAETFMDISRYDFRAKPTNARISIELSP